MKTTLQTGPVHPAWLDRFCFYCYAEGDFEMAIPLLELYLCFLSSGCLCLESLPALSLQLSETYFESILSEQSIAQSWNHKSHFRFFDGIFLSFPSFCNQHRDMNDTT